MVWVDVVDVFGVTSVGAAFVVFALFAGCCLSLRFVRKVVVGLFASLPHGRGPLSRY